MFRKGKSAEAKAREKERKKRGARQYGQAKLKYSVLGVYSCGLAAVTFLLLAAAIVTAYLTHGEAAGFTGGFGILSVLFSVLGLRASLKGRKEKNCRYTVCTIGTVVNGLFLLGLAGIFAGGIL